MKVSIVIVSSLFLASCNSVDFKPEAVHIPDSDNCVQYLANNPAAVDGTYQLNLDGDATTALQTAYCDFTGGGWTTIMSPQSTILDLEDIGDTSDISASFSSDPVKGLAWQDSINTGGNNPTAALLACFVMTKVKNISRVKAKVSWASTPNAIGFFFMGNKIDVNRYANWTEYYAIHSEEGFASTWNSWTGSNGSSRVTQHFVSPTVDPFTNYNGAASIGVIHTVEGDYTSNGNLEICMGGELPYNYDARYITELSFK